MVLELLSLSLNAVFHSVKRASKKSFVQTSELIYPLIHVLLSTENSKDLLHCIGTLRELCEKNTNNRELVSRRGMVPFLWRMLAEERVQDLPELQNQILALLLLLCDHHPWSEEVKDIICSHGSFFVDLLENFETYPISHKTIFLLERITEKTAHLSKLFSCGADRLIPLLVKDLKLNIVLHMNCPHAVTTTSAAIESLLTILDRSMQVDGKKIVAELLVRRNMLRARFRRHEGQLYYLPGFLLISMRVEEKIHELAMRIINKMEDYIGEPLRKKLRLI